MCGLKILHATKFKAIIVYITTNKLNIYNWGLEVPSPVHTHIWTTFKKNLKAQISLMICEDTTLNQLCDSRIKIRRQSSQKNIIYTESSHTHGVTADQIIYTCNASNSI